MKQHNRILRLFLSALVIIAIAAGVCACTPNVQTVTPENVRTVRIEGFRDTLTAPESEDGQLLEICRIGSYSGIFVEQGTDTPCKNICALVVCNRSDAMLEKAVLTQGTARYVVTWLPPEGICLVQAVNERTQDTKDAVLISELTFSSEPPSMHGSRIGLTATEGQITIENISGEDIPGSVNVWYKTKNNGLYLGGVSYKAAVDDGVLFAHSAASVHTAHFDTEKSEILLVTFSND